MRKTYHEMADVFDKNAEKFMKVDVVDPKHETIDMTYIGCPKLTTTANNRTLCGSPGCVGGYLRAFYIADGCDFQGRTPDLPYLEGAHFLAEDLGFTGKDSLTRFFDAHQDIWGNRFGEYMFSCEKAYSKAGDDLHAWDIGNHYFAVAERLRNA